MAKRYGNSKMNRGSENMYHAESQGEPVMSRPMHKHNRGRSMIDDDRSATANLPRMIKQEMYDNAYQSFGHYGEDLYGGVEMRLKEDKAGMNKIFKPSKY